MRQSYGKPQLDNHYTIARSPLFIIVARIALRSLKAVPVIYGLTTVRENTLPKLIRVDGRKGRQRRRTGRGKACRGHGKENGIEDRQEQRYKGWRYSAAPPPRALLPHFFSKCLTRVDQLTAPQVIRHP